MRRLRAAIAALLARPIPMVLYCPCGVQHVDTEEWATTRHHRTHLCKPEDGGCGKVFRPSNLSTVGVKAL